MLFDCVNDLPVGAVQAYSQLLALPVIRVPIHKHRAGYIAVPVPDSG